MSEFKTGDYIVENKSKYIGNKNPRFRSSWEQRVMYFLDSHPSVEKWAYEKIILNYVSPKDSRLHKYILDFYAEIKQKDGSIKKYLIEVKPKNQGPNIKSNYEFDYSNKPIPPKTKSEKAMRNYIAKMQTYAVNTAKWQSAVKFCLHRGLDFMLINENDITIR